jgi:sigma-54-specific transcriptional regulator
VRAPSPHLFETVSELLVRAAYTACHGNQVRTAQTLGISRNVLRAQLARLAIIPGRRR